MDGMGESGVDGLAFGPQISSSEATTYNIPIFRVWVIRNPWAVLFLFMGRGNREGSKQCQSLIQGNIRINIHLELICKYFSRRDFLKLVVLFSFLSRRLNPIQDNLKMKFSEPWKMGGFLWHVFSNHRLISKLSYKIDIGSFIFFLRKYFWYMNLFLNSISHHSKEVRQFMCTKFISVQEITTSRSWTWIF